LPTDTFFFKLRFPLNGEHSDVENMTNGN